LDNAAFGEFFAELRLESGAKVAEAELAPFVEIKQPECGKFGLLRRVEAALGEQSPNVTAIGDEVRSEREHGGVERVVQVRDIADFGLRFHLRLGGAVGLGDHFHHGRRRFFETREDIPRFANRASHGAGQGDELWRVGKITERFADDLCGEACEL
jgi:hypothetical protein